MQNNKRIAIVGSSGIGKLQSTVSDPFNEVLEPMELSNYRLPLGQYPVADNRKSRRKMLQNAKRSVKKSRRAGLLK
jgi:hypothetical protein